MVEHGPQPVADTLSRLSPVGLHEAHVRERERDDKDVQDLPDPRDDGLGLTEIDLSGASRPHQFREALPSLTVADVPLPHETLHRRITAGETPLSHQTIKDALSRMALLTRPTLILAQPLFNGIFEAGQDRAGDETHLKCSRGVSASFHKCSRNAGHRVGAAVCLADGSNIVDECTPGDHEEACHRVWECGQES